MFIYLSAFKEKYNAKSSFFITLIKRIEIHWSQFLYFALLNEKSNPEQKFFDRDYSNINHNGLS